MAWSQEGRLASGSVDGTVIVWDLENGTPAQTLSNPSDSGWVNSVPGRKMGNWPQDQMTAL